MIYLFALIEKSQHNDRPYSTYIDSHPLANILQPVIRHALNLCDNDEVISCIKCHLLASSKLRSSGMVTRKHLIILEVDPTTVLRGNPA